MDLHLRIPSIPVGTLDTGSIQVLISFALGIVAIFLSALANRFHWSATLKFVVVVLVCLLAGVLQLALQGLLDGVHAFKAFALILLSSQAFYGSKPIRDLAAKLERVTTPGETIREFLQTGSLSFDMPYTGCPDYTPEPTFTPPAVPDPPASPVAPL